MADQWDELLLPTTLVANTPSLADCIAQDVEAEYRFFGTQLIAEAGVLLKVPQVVVATAQTCFQRLFYRRSFKAFDAHHVAMAALFLAGKVEESTRRMRDIINVVYHLKQRWECIHRTGAPPPGGRTRPLLLGGSLYITWKAALTRAERFILKDLGFAMYSISDNHPHKLLLYYLKALGCTGGPTAAGASGASGATGAGWAGGVAAGGTPTAEDNALLASLAWAALNDSLRTTLCVRAAPEAIACAAIHLASSQFGTAQSMMRGERGQAGASNPSSDGATAGSSSSSYVYPLPRESQWHAVFMSYGWDHIVAIAGEIAAAQARSTPPRWMPSLRPDWKRQDDEEDA